MKPEKCIDIKSISELHRLANYPGPAHPLISVIDDHAGFASQTFKVGQPYRIGFYTISCKTVQGAPRYGRDHYDFSNGTLLLTAPGQVTAATPEFVIEEGWILLIHPELLYGTSLGKRMLEYTFFNYEVNEALHVSDEEHALLKDCVDKINRECLRGTDHLTQTILVSHIELMLHYCERFYQRQFYTRAKVNRDILQRFENLLRAYFLDQVQLDKGLPSVGYFADSLHLSPSYLSDLLQKFTGKSTLEHIHLFLVEQAKALLWGSEASISEIAYQLGFGHPSQFTRLFKSKTGYTPTGFRNLN
jgi:AraC-like DNA-binding protein